MISFALILSDVITQLLTLLLFQILGPFLGIGA